MSRLRERDQLAAN